MIRPVELAVVAAAAGGFLAASCATVSPSKSGVSLTGTEWRLVEFESSDDAIGVIRPRNDELYTLRFDPDGSVAMTLSCNRGAGGWKSPDAHLARGSLTIEPIASTMAACDPKSPLDRIAADVGRVRSFVIAGGRLHLNLMMDGGNYVWVPSK